MAEGLIRGPLFGLNGSDSPLTGDTTSALRVTDAHARYADAILSGRVYMMSVAAAAPTAYVGAAGGTPLLAIHNPTASGYVAIPLFATFTGRAAASAAGTVAFELWSGISAQPTGTVTTPRNARTLQQTGSEMIGFSNAALTGSTALNLICGLGTYYWATAAAAFMSPGYVDIGGVGTIVPGNQLAIGVTAALTTATWSVTLYWEELPYSAA